LDDAADREGAECRESTIQRDLPTVGKPARPKGDRDWTMQRIAKALNVSKAQIGVDLENFNCPATKQSKHAKTASNWTMQRIAKALNVSQSTITEDLRNLSTADKSKPARTASNPKGAGRPKGSAKRQRRTTQPATLPFRWAEFGPTLLGRPRSATFADVEVDVEVPRS
jgi:transcriptional regulator with XRE-family HTH domain